MNSIAISIEGVSKSYDDGLTQAVGDLSLSIEPNEFIALVGGSGSGKTTTLKMINRLVAQDCGAISVLRQRTDAVAGHELRRRIGYVFQGVGLFPHMTIAENVAVTPNAECHPHAHHWIEHPPGDRNQGARWRLHH
ncbi:ATP-binding cassette domain-containing protein [Methylocystis suflitae]|uniref:ATP-binding cassette domain-containing protein n=1 Tax=Methylocystis suflitae TaxID=2951405 RepID=UPI003898DF75